MGVRKPLSVGVIEGLGRRKYVPKVGLGQGGLIGSIVQAVG